MQELESVGTGEERDAVGGFGGQRKEDGSQGGVARVSRAYSRALCLNGLATVVRHGGY